MTKVRSIDPLSVAAVLTKGMPEKFGASLGWRLGERANRMTRTARLRGGGNVAVDVGDYGQREMFFRGEYERSTTRLLRSIATPAWTFLDIGANVGYFSVVAMNFGGPDATVIAFEPNPRLYKMLHQTAAMNAPSFVAEQMACGSAATTLPLYLSPQDRNSGLSTLLADVYPSADTISVPVVALDDYCSARTIEPAVAKIDVEGFEFEVLRGAQRLIAGGCLRWIIVEVGHVDPQPMMYWLADRGYKANRIRDDGSLDPVAQYRTDRGGFRLENLCFVTSKK